MLQSIRNASRHWLGKVVLTVIFTFLIAGVAIFGVEEFFRGGSSTTVATVGKTPISAEAVRGAYQNQLQRYQAQFKRALTPDQARALGLERQVLAQLITEAALDQKTADLGLAVSDAAVLRAIQEEPSFRNANGAFDRAQFFQTLQRAGLNEAMFVREQRSVIARMQLADAIVSELPVPQALREAVHRFSTERRGASVLTLAPSAAGEIPAPTDAELQAYYDDDKSAFRAPEFRSLNLLVLDPAALAKPEDVSDEEARKLYEANHDRFGKAERRTIQQISFPDEAAAKEARARIESGETPFETVAAERGLDPKELDLGTLTKAELFDPAVGNAAFALEPGKVSEPVKGRFGTVLLRVTAAEPGTVKPFDEVKDEIRKEIALRRVRDGGLDKVQDAIEDARAAAKPLAEIARDQGLTLLGIPAVDAQGNDPSGKPVEGIPDKETTLPAAFRADVGNDTEVLRTKTGGAIWYDVVKIDPSHEKPLAEVRDEAVKGWTKAEVEKRLVAKSKALTERLDKGEAVETVAQEAGLPLKAVTGIARNQTRDDLSNEVVERIFATPVGKAASASSGGGRTVFKVTAAAMPAFVPGTPSDHRLAGSLRTALADDVLAEFIAEVRKSAGVNVDQTALRRALGGEY
ncbi:MAG: SurA N-terminal domain-containing protein [Methylorubrum populi]